MDRKSEAGMYTVYFQVVNTLGPNEKFKMVATDVPEGLLGIVANSPTKLSYFELGTFFSRAEIERFVKNGFRAVIEPANFVTLERRRQPLQMRILPGHTFEPVGVRKSS